MRRSLYRVISCIYVVEEMKKIFRLYHQTGLFGYEPLQLIVC